MECEFMFCVIDPNVFAQVIVSFLMFHLGLNIQRAQISALKVCWVFQFVSREQTALQKSKSRTWQRSRYRSRCVTNSCLCRTVIYRFILCEVLTEHVGTFRWAINRLRCFTQRFQSLLFDIVAEGRSRCKNLSDMGKNIKPNVIFTIGFWQFVLFCILSCSSVFSFFV